MRMRVTDDVHVGPCPHDLGVQRPFEVAQARALEHVAVEVDEDEVIALHLGEREVAALEPQAAAEGVAVREMAHRHIAVALEFEDPVCARNVVQHGVDGLLLVVETRGVAHLFIPYSQFAASSTVMPPTRACTLPPVATATTMRSSSGRGPSGTVRVMVS